MKTAKVFRNAGSQAARLSRLSNGEDYGSVEWYGKSADR